MKKRHKSISYARYGYYFCIPFVVVFLIFSLYPTIYTALLGFTNSKGLGNISWQFLDQPFRNFEVILKNKSFKLSVINTLHIWILNFIPQILLALLLTAWFTSPSIKLRGKGLFKVLFYMPNIITAASIAILFYSLFGYPTGPVNYALEKLGIINEGIQFLSLKSSARNIIAFIQFWMWYGYTMIILISGVLGINPQIFEAADIDGASSMQTFFRITLPNLKTIMLYVLVTSMIGGLNMFDIPKVMFNNGAPDNATLTASVFIYNQAFAGSYMYARASAASMLVFVVIAILSGFTFFLMRDKDEVKERKAFKKMQRQNRKVQKTTGGAIA
ncbi:MAG TPA: sugar ABC transporter permease [Candidatus Limiplasma sp.]|nr:sugar ABC transporter permease [Candidatus Limiplasma sp.]